jgi:hypothetical protein
MPIAQNHNISFHRYIFCYNFRTMIAGFAPRLSRNDVLKITVVLLRILSLGVAFAYAIARR